MYGRNGKYFMKKVTLEVETARLIVNVVFFVLLCFKNPHCHFSATQQ